MPNWAKTTLKLVVSLGLLAYLFLKIDLGETLDSLATVAWWALVLGALVVLGDRSCNWTRMRTLLRARGKAVTYPELMRVYWIGDFAATFLPGTLAVDVFRIYTLSRGYAGLKDVTVAVAVERMSGSLSILIIALTGATLGLFGAQVSSDQFLSILLLTAAGVTGVALFLWLGPKILERLKRTGGRLATKAGKLADAFFEYKDKKAALAAAFGISLLIQLFRVLFVFVLALGMGIDVSPFHFLVFVPIIFLLNMIPVSISSWGVQEGGFVVLFGYAGVTPADALALSILVRIIVFFVALPGLPLYLKYGLHRKETVEAMRGGQAESEPEASTPA